ncbi:MAG TPA: hypothetical protein VFP59_18710 [Candidatus Angelobacter sp.]|nr:hypothetical protein [Candidatus Angelobacter sp.]
MHGNIIKLPQIEFVQQVYQLRQFMLPQSRKLHRVGSGSAQHLKPVPHVTACERSGGKADESSRVAAVELFATWRKPRQCSSL